MLNSRHYSEEGVSSLIGYIVITSILITMMIIMILVVNNAVMERPVIALLDHSFVDIGNGVSTRMLEVYIIAPTNLADTGSVNTSLDIPDEVVGRDYLVEVYTPTWNPPLAPDDPRNWGNDLLTVSGGGGNPKNISLAGIGAGLEFGITGSTTARGVNSIRYSSEGL
jgi:hypothetical protein